MCWRHLPQASQPLKVEGAKSWAGAARRLGWSTVREIATPRLAGSREGTTAHSRLVSSSSWGKSASGKPHSARASPRRVHMHRASLKAVLARG